ncbi:MAG: FAD-binding oxidoreductase, partial [Thermomicrobiales bacterium]
GTREHVWVGMRPLTPDGLPVIGRAPGGDNLYVATGHQMLGMTLAPATGQALAELMLTGQSEVDLFPFDPLRF